MADLPRPAPRTWSDRVFPWVWAALGLFLVIRTGIRERGVITDHLEFGRRVLMGLDLYAPFTEPGEPLHPPYPPSFGLLTAPFSLLPEAVARFAWGITQVLALWWIGLRLRGWLTVLAPQHLPRLHWLLLGAAAIGSRYILRDAHGGGGNLVNLALVLGALHHAERGRPMAAGALLGFSLATKPTGVLLLPLLLLFGRRAAAAATVLWGLSFLGLALGLLGQGLAPLERWLGGTLAYARQVDLFATPAEGFPPFTWMNQSLRCALARYLGDVPPAFAEQVPGWFPGLGLPATTEQWLRLAGSTALLLATFALAWRRRAGGRGRPALVAAVLALSLLLSPISWKAHHVALLPAFFLLALQLAEGRRRLWWFVGVYALLCVVGEEVQGKAVKNLQQSLYLTTAGTVFLWAASLLDARRRNETGPAGSVPPPQ
ncbi:MAG: DUF2029 domain-containing protein [Planctomycetes bacterium]|nr:DUF2029 domain-containing protein [Planctomycetota bacterium]